MSRRIVDRYENAPEPLSDETLTELWELWQGSALDGRASIVLPSTDEEIRFASLAFGLHALLIEVRRLKDLLARETTIDGM